MQKKFLDIFGIIIDAGISIVIPRLLIVYCGIKQMSNYGVVNSVIPYVLENQNSQCGRKTDEIQERQGKNLVVLNPNWKYQYERSSIDIMFISITVILMLSLYSSPTVSTEKDLETMANSIKNKEISMPRAHMVVVRKDFA